ncbi:hypothetical protein VTJ04DRAFT_144 [Mycothermus thermophilus]|uniref:uncharacterized protein n=1 Tax=Humicola insolens TaxID=85995 RepID=UPI00374281E1
MSMRILPLLLPCLRSYSSIILHVDFSKLILIHKKLQTKIITPYKECCQLLVINHESLSLTFVSLPSWS